MQPGETLSIRTTKAMAPLVDQFNALLAASHRTRSEIACEALALGIPLLGKRYTAMMENNLDESKRAYEQLRKLFGGDTDDPTMWGGVNPKK